MSLPGKTTTLGCARDILLASVGPGWKPFTRMSHDYWGLFVELIRTPFLHVELVWGIVPLYFGLLLNEMTSSKTNYLTAVQTGFSFLWAGAQWLYPYLKFRGGAQVQLSSMSPIVGAVTALVLVLGVIAFVSGLRKRYPPYGSFLGHTRFANYFMIVIFPMQSPIQAYQLPWTWERLITIGLFAVPIWLVLHYGLMPIRGAKR
jgi:hypothetical protein